MLKDPFFKMKKSEIFALLRKELYETIELGDVVQSYSHKCLLSKHRPNERSGYSCDSKTISGFCRSGQDSYNRQYLLGWVCYKCDFDLCITCLKID